MRRMKLEDAMVYALATAGRGMTTKLLATVINEQHLHVRQDGKPVTEKQIYAAVCRNPAVFIKEGGRILLLM